MINSKLIEMKKERQTEGGREEGGRGRLNTQNISDNKK